MPMPWANFVKMAADLPDADDAEHLVVEFDAHEFVFFPLAGLHRCGGLRNAPAHGTNHRHRVLGSGDRIAARRIHDHDAATGRRRGIDIIQTRTRPARRLSVSRRLQSVPPSLWCRTARSSPSASLISLNSSSFGILDFTTTANPAFSRSSTPCFDKTIADQEFSCRLYLPSFEVPYQEFLAPSPHHSQALPDGPALSAPSQWPPPP